MDNIIYGNLNVAIPFLQAIPQSASSDTVTVQIQKQSDNAYWHFDTLDFEASIASGNMVNQAGEWWRQTFTPDAAGMYFITITNSTLGVSYYQTVIVSGIEPGGTSGALTTLENVKLFLGIDDTDDDIILAELILKATKEAETYTNRNLIADDFTEYFDGDSRRSLTVKNYPINSVDSINDDFGRDYGASTIIDPTTYSSRGGANSGVIKFDYHLANGRDNVRVIYNGGYATTPHDLELAVKLLICGLFLLTKSQVNTQDGEDIISGRIKSLKEHGEEILDRYRSAGNLN